ncbi:Cation/H+ exchanger [Mycena belliarum]|uniref:Cation/H+ exchanger n=1 Tax=Mycena belliarum TaxID=1033014 RepID=A0AAD6TV20_9AGAR|nr:Cation/H+ exchanger [Mycena belliae]
MPTSYTAPHIPLLLAVSSFLYLINVAETSFSRLFNAGLLGPLCVGIVFGADVANILPEALQDTFVTLGYIGLLLIVFEAGLSTDIALLFDNILLSCVVAMSGMGLPIAFSMFLLHFGYGYTAREAFAAGAALCSTSLGTTLSVLKPAYRGTRTGTVLLAAALLDDIGGLVIAGILSQLAAYGTATSTVPWHIIVRPILVSFGFAFGVPALAVGARYLLKKVASARLSLPTAQLFVLVATLSGFVAGAKYAGTSELFGAYLAGAFLTYTFSTAAPTSPRQSDEDLPPPVRTFHRHIAPLLQILLSPLFFASIGSALPIRSLGTVEGSHRVIWRGIVYSLLMAISKVVVGLWMLIWPDWDAGRGWFGRHVHRPTGDVVEDIDNDEGATSLQDLSPSSDFTATRSAALVGLAMIARGEIALIVAEIARPLLDSTSLEPFAVVMWATLLNTAGGAAAVGFLLRERKTTRG